MDDTTKTRRMNDLFRQTFSPALGKTVLTAGIADLPTETQLKIFGRVRAFQNFTSDNDPRDEHDFGSFDIDGVRVLWKIDYYARGSGLTAGSEDPADAARTERVITIMTAEEY